MSESNVTSTNVSSMEELEQIKQEQQQKIDNLKTLLIKAKQTIQKYKSENVKQSEELTDYKQKNEQMEQLLKKYFGEENSDGQVKQNINKDLKIQELLAEVLLNGVKWMCVRFDNYSIEWVRAEQLNLSKYQLIEDNEEQKQGEKSGQNTDNSQQELEQQNQNDSTQNSENNENSIKESQQQQGSSQKDSEEQQLLPILKKPTCVDYNRISEQSQQSQVNAKKYDEDLKNVILQYEERIKRMQEESDTTEQKLQALQKKFDLKKQRVEEMKQTLIDISNNIIEESGQIRENCLLFMAEETNDDENQKKEELQAIKYLLIKLQKLHFELVFLDPVNNLKDHILMLLQTLFDNLKKQKIQKEESQQEINQLKVQIQKLKAQIQHEKKEKNEILGQSRKKISELETTYEKYKSDTILQLKDKEVKIDFLNKELQKNVNNQYIKNVLIKFFMSEQNVQEKLLNGLATVLQFSEDELKEVREKFFQKKNTGIKGMFGF